MTHALKRRWGIRYCYRSDRNDLLKLPIGFCNMRVRSVLRRVSPILKREFAASEICGISFCDM